jgi:N-acetylmuramoyl-L-alanine amidase
VESTEKLTYKYFELPTTKLYRFVIDINGKLSNDKFELDIDGVDKVKVAQFDKNRVRIVIYNEKRFIPQVSKSENLLKITIPNNENNKTQKQPEDDDIFSSIVISDKKIKKINEKLIIIDPGHGGKDGGAIGYQSLLEKDVVLSISKLISKKLKQSGFDTYLTRDDDTFIELTERTKIANRKKGDIFISIHANSTANPNSDVKGIETYFLSPARSDRAKKAAQKENAMEINVMNTFFQNVFLNVLNKEKIVSSNKLGIDIQKSLISNLKTKYDDIHNNGVREAPFWVLVGATMPAVLIEVGYINNHKEGLRIANSEYQEDIAEGISEGIKNYFNKN